MWVFEGGSIVFNGDTIDDTTKSRAIVVESLPEPENREGYQPQIRANLETNTLYYDYIPIIEE
jgi:hypothetical protein